ncbi:sialic acid binding Ig-like lectin 15, like isoform X2 [Dunckerocampus dactyliophorus]|nr:sialic acid binding Ig-like lectin 15, like isoform X2 [Dunckerocampus dactyliophorus]
MNVSREVVAWRGQDAVLGCSFTHREQERYAGNIKVQWRARQSTMKPFFECSFKNISSEGPGDCSSAWFSLRGDPRQGVLSLLISGVKLTDEGVYFCCIELDGKLSQIKELKLKVLGKPEILSLSLVNDSAPQKLQCAIEGNPLPNITWLSASRGPLAQQVHTSQIGQYQLASWVPYDGEDRVTCKAESQVGRAERTHPPSNSLTIAVIAGSVAVLLLLATGVVVLLLRLRALKQQSTLHENAPPEEDRSLHCTQGPAEDAVELQLVYATVELPASCEGATCTPDLLYSTVSMH